MDVYGYLPSIRESIQTVAEMYTAEGCISGRRCVGTDCRPFTRAKFKSFWIKRSIITRGMVLFWWRTLQESLLHGFNSSVHFQGFTEASVQPPSVFPWSQPRRCGEFWRDAGRQTQEGPHGTLASGEYSLRLNKVCFFICKYQQRRQISGLIGSLVPFSLIFHFFLFLFSICIHCLLYFFFPIASVASCLSLFLYCVTSNVCLFLPLLSSVCVSIHLFYVLVSYPGSYLIFITLHSLHIARIDNGSLHRLSWTFIEISIWSTTIT